jgi:two-component system, response regulator / RNA-binding antiterminator
MRAWLLQGRQGEDPGELRPVFRLCADRSLLAGWRLEVQPLAAADLAARVQAQRPEVVISAVALCPLRSWIEEMLALDLGLVLAGEESELDAYRDLSERLPVLFAPSRPTAEEMTFALCGARDALRRQQYWKTQVEQLHQRLNDRIVIERAKGLLVQRLGIGEEEAYKRLRVLSRRQRRQIRDIAQSLLDTQSLLMPPGNNGHQGGELLSGETPPAEQSPGLPGPKPESP